MHRVQWPVPILCPPPPRAASPSPSLLLLLLRLLLLPAAPRALFGTTTTFNARDRAQTAHRRAPRRADLALDDGQQETGTGEGSLGHGAGVVWAGVYNFIQWKKVRPASAPRDCGGGGGLRNRRGGGAAQGPDFHFTAWRRTDTVPAPAPSPTIAPGGPPILPWGARGACDGRLSSLRNPLGLSNPSPR